MSTYKTEVREWSDNFIQSLAKSEDSIDFCIETASVFEMAMSAEARVQELYDKGEEEKVEEPFLLQVLISRMDYLKVPRTRAAEVLISLGVNTPGEAVMMACAFKRLYELQSPKPERITASHVETLLNGGTISKDFYRSQWDKQKGYLVNLPVDNLLDTSEASDFEN